jgi:hypothetical protein
MKRIFTSLALAILATLYLSVTVFATVGTVTYLTGRTSNTSITLSWAKASGSSNTIVRYSTTGYPATYADGTSAYSGTGSEVTVSSLTSGQTYFFGAWGFDGGSTYSAASATWVTTTLAEALPSGAESSLTNPRPTATTPANINQAPDESSFNLEPFTSIITYFNSANPGGLGMPASNAWSLLAILGIVGSGLITYIKIKNFFIAYFVVLVVTIICVGLKLTQGYLVGIEIIVGAGIWAIERYSQ